MKVLVSSLLISAALIACSGDDDSGTTVVSSESVTLNFAAKAGDVTIDCNTTLTGLGSTAVSGKIQDFRFYLHDIVLLDATGTEYPFALETNDWQSESVGLVDFQNKSDRCSGDEAATHPMLTGTVAAGVTAAATSIQFKLGIPASLNHADQGAANKPLNIASLFWNWQGGYKFARIDFAPEGGITRPGDETFSGTSFNFHLGSTGCTGEAAEGEEVSCTYSNRPTILLEDFSLDKTIVFDYAALVADVDLSVDEGVAPGCMSGTTDPECASVFEKLALDMSTGDSSTSLTQTVFSLE